MFEVCGRYVESLEKDRLRIRPISAGISKGLKDERPGYLRKNLRKPGQKERNPEGFLIGNWSGKRDSKTA